MAWLLRVPLLMMMAVGLCSCQTQPAPLPVPTADKSLDSSTLAYELAAKDWCTHGDAVSMLLLMVDGEDRYQTYAERLEVLEERGYIDPMWNLRAHQKITKGSLAYMLCVANNVKGGVMMHVLPSRRYAYIEAVQMGWIDRGSEYEPVTGPEALGIFGRASRQAEDE